MLVRDAIRKFSSPQEVDLLDRSVKKIKECSVGHSLAKNSSTEMISTSVPGAAVASPENPEIVMGGCSEPSIGNNSQHATVSRNATFKDVLVDANMVDIASGQGTSGAVSFKDKLVGAESPVAITFSTIPSYMEEESDVDEDPEDDTPVVLLSKAEKQRIRAPWMNALIVKAFHHKPLGYNYIFPRLKAQWKPTGHWDFIDLGLDFFLVRFQVEEDLHRVIFGGPWFVGPYFLTLRRWEPHFVPSEALNSFTTTAVWAQLPNLSADYYDPSTLQKIGNKVGNLLRVDAHTAHHTRGQYARICVQIDLSKPVVKYVRIGRRRQKVLYEGVNALCFSCGRIGHRNSQCSNGSSLSANIAPMAGTNIPNHSLTPPTRQNNVEVHSNLEATQRLAPLVNNHLRNDSQMQEDQVPSSESSRQDEFGPWLLVERRRNRRKPSQVSDQSEKTIPTKREGRGSGSQDRKGGSRHQAGQMASSSNGQPSGSFNADQTHSGSPSTVIKDPITNSKTDGKVSSKNLVRAGNDGQRPIAKDPIIGPSSVMAPKIQMVYQKKKLSNTNPTAKTVTAPTNHIQAKPIQASDAIHLSSTFSNGSPQPPTVPTPSMVVDDQLAPSSQFLNPSNSPPLNLVSNLSSPDDLSISPVKHESCGFLNIKWKAPPSGIGLGSSISLSTTAPSLSHHLPDHACLEVSDPNSQGYNTSEALPSSSSTSYRNGKGLASFLHVGPKLQRKRRTYRKSNHPYQASSASIPGDQETLLLPPTNGPNGTASSLGLDVSISRDSIGNGSQLHSAPIPQSEVTDADGSVQHVALSSGQSTSQGDLGSS
ncbi:hypothetical protein SLEP1_g24101 [Rubroshorea leprosula]|uniref:CCHC-type domain-containing protein n=1 Tax=Rubroshorea leprosula TaxID=152421 RepID=A0AAV5JNU5_9ROSI|nr:hypothetical protein SLEP1_g24101 [Rubroshorea leprosula]